MWRINVDSSAHFSIIHLLIKRRRWIRIRLFALLEFLSTFRMSYVMVAFDVRRNAFSLFSELGAFAFSCWWIRVRMYYVRYSRVWIACLWVDARRFGTLGYRCIDRHLIREHLVRHEIVGVSALKYGKLAIVAFSTWARYNIGTTHGSKTIVYIKLYYSA